MTTLTDTRRYVQFPLDDGGVVSLEPLAIAFVQKGGRKQVSTDPRASHHEWTDEYTTVGLQGGQNWWHVAEDYETVMRKLHEWEFGD